jgi:hypothetical protein
MIRIKIGIRISEVVEGQLLPVPASTCLIDDFGVAVDIEIDIQETPANLSKISFENSRFFAWSLTR